LIQIKLLCTALCHWICRLNRGGGLIQVNGEAAVVCTDPPSAASRQPTSTSQQQETVMATAPVEVKKTTPAPTNTADAWRSFRTEIDRLFDRFRTDLV